MTPKQQRFVEEYLVDLNATQAAIRAGYSARTAEKIGSENIRKPEIAKAIGEAQRRRSKRTEITQDRVLKELARVGFANLTDVVSWGTKEVAIGYDDDGKKLPPADIGDAVVVLRELAPYVDAIESADLKGAAKAAVAEVALTKDGLKLKMHDKVGALTQIGRHLGMFTDKTEMTGKDGGPVEHRVVDAPPNETREQWMERKRREMEEAARVVPATRSAV